MKYIAKFEEAEEGGFTVTFPDAPGAITEGDTEAEARSMAKDALEGWLQTQLNVKRLPPRPAFKGSGTPIVIDADLALKLELRWAREDAGLTQAQLAKLVGVGQQRIAALESPDREVKLSTASRVMSALGRELTVSSVKLAPKRLTPATARR